MKCLKRVRVRVWTNEKSIKISVLNCSNGSNTKCTKCTQGNGQAQAQAQGKEK
jgi:hypothetical protein